MLACGDHPQKHGGYGAETRPARGQARKMARQPGTCAPGAMPRRQQTVAFWRNLAYSPWVLSRVGFLNHWVSFLNLSHV
jgi:hypothetical protein